MANTEKQLSNMNDVEEMWLIFASSFRKAIDASVPVKSITLPAPNQPPWFNQRTKKPIDNQHKTLTKYKKDSGLFLINKY